MALVLGAVLLTWSAAQNRRWQRWVWAGCLWWLALFAHYFAALALASVFLALILAPQTRTRWRPGLWMGAGITLAQLPTPVLRCAPGEQHSAQHQRHQN